MAIDSKANYAATGALLGDYWSINNTPAAATQATASKAAGAAGVQHVARRATVAIAAAGTAQPALNFNLRDGATGAGTILWSVSLACIINTSVLWSEDFSLAPLVGTAATAMTLESSAAGAAATLANITLIGYDIQ